MQVDKTCFYELVKKSVQSEYGLSLSFWGVGELIRLSRLTHRAAVDYCNDGDERRYNKTIDRVKKATLKVIANCELNGQTKDTLNFTVGGDPRGFTFFLKFKESGKVLAPESWGFSR